MHLGIFGPGNLHFVAIEWEQVIFGIRNFCFDHFRMCSRSAMCVHCSLIHTEIRMCEGCRIKGEFLMTRNAVRRTIKCLRVKDSTTNGLWCVKGIRQKVFHDTSSMRVFLLLFAKSFNYAFSSIRFCVFAYKWREDCIFQNSLGIAHLHKLTTSHREPTPDSLDVQMSDRFRTVSTRHSLSTNASTMIKTMTIET